MVITVSNQKGGVGKTTTSAALAAGFSMAGKKVLCIDLDPQGNLGFCLGLDTEGGSTILDEHPIALLNQHESLKHVMTTIIISVGG